MSNNGWIGVDLDGTLAHYDGWRGIYHVGDPIQPMLDRVKGWLADGKDVRIFTARVAEECPNRLKDVIRAIEIWCLRHLQCKLPITNVKDFSMVELWDDRAIQIVKNEGIRADGQD